MIHRRAQTTMRFGDLKALLAGTISHAPEPVVFKGNMSFSVDTFGIQDLAQLHLGQLVRKTNNFFRYVCVCVCV